MTKPQINVTPLIDVLLVLLIIFMVVVPLMERGREVELPKTRNHVADKDTLQPIVIIEREGEGRVLVKAHPEAFYEKVYPVIMSLHELGATGIDLGTKEFKEK